MIYRSKSFKSFFSSWFGQESVETIHILKDINFSINVNESVGIIGKNGSGKTTLLKLIARITVPTKGTISVKGKIAPLLELTASFHEELTGRDNALLGGIILGMPKKVAEAHLDKIASYAGVTQFFDTQIKKYSSGMRARLGFSVAIHSRPDTILLDEIFAVGDRQFQKKCLQEMKALKKKGKTIIIVSHDMNIIRSFCTRVLLLHNKQIIADGKPDAVIRDYVRINNEE